MNQLVIKYYPKIIDFLEYNPSAQPQSLSEKLIDSRQILGLFQKEYAQLVGVDLNIISDWENGEHTPIFARH